MHVGSHTYVWLGKREVGAREYPPKKRKRWTHVWRTVRASGVVNERVGVWNTPKKNKKKKCTYGEPYMRLEKCWRGRCPIAGAGAAAAAGQAAAADAGQAAADVAAADATVVVVVLWSSSLS